VTHPPSSDSSEDPVDRLIATARGDAVADPFRVTGVMMQYYHVCKRELWLASRNLEIDRENVAVVRGTHVDDSSYGDRSEESLRLGMISLDLLEDGRVVEVKPSSTLTEPARMQLSYYLWYLDRIAGVKREGVLAHPTERRRESVELTDERAEKVEGAIRGIHGIITEDSPPPAEEKPFCDACAYHDLCWC
jgi:CRISPR-associated exonuclease Cas4